MRADALDYTGLWYNSTQPGYGFNFAQSDDYIFGTFFIYAQNGAPSFYIASLASDGHGSFTGELSGTVGTWFALPWIPSNFIETVVGTATFTPSTANAYEATITLAVNGLTPVTYPIQRQTLTAIALSGAPAATRVSSSGFGHALIGWSFPSPSVQRSRAAAGLLSTTLRAWGMSRVSALMALIHSTITSKALPNDGSLLVIERHST